MSVDDLKPKDMEVNPVPDQAKEKEEKKGSFKSLFVMAAVAVGAIFLLKKFKGKFPNKGDEPMMAP